MRISFITNIHRYPYDLATDAALNSLLRNVGVSCEEIMALKDIPEKLITLSQNVDALIANQKDPADAQAAAVVESTVDGLITKTAAALPAPAPAV